MSEQHTSQVDDPDASDEPADPFGHDLPPVDAYEADAAAAVTREGARGQDQGADFSGAGSADEQAGWEQRQRAEREALFERLNERQREAVFMPHKSALVLAAAGSGKTSVLTSRIARLVTAGEPSLSARAVLAVTFTNKAAQEMRSRLGKMLDRRVVNDLWVGTFHSLCNRLLRENAEAAGLPKTFAILDVDAQEALCRGVLKDMGLTKAAVKATAKKAAAAAQGDLLGGTADPDGVDRIAAAGAITAAQAAQAGVVDGGDDGEFVTPSQCASYIASRKEKGFAPSPPREQVTIRSRDIDQMEAVFAEYVARCNRAGLLDFQDLLTRAVQLLETSREVREKVQTRFQAILVDEFQDTNAIQYKWLSLLKSPRAHVMAVGDDDQSIYAFRGAQPENMALFLKDMAAEGDGTPGRLIRLEDNYRSLPHILAAANAVIERNTNRLGKVLRTDKPDRGELIDLVHYGSGVFEAQSVAREINALVKTRGVAPCEIAVLYRANQQSRLLEAELNKLGLPLTVYGGFRFYERQEVKYALAYLDLVLDITHDLSFVRIANFPPRGLGERTLEELRQDAQLRSLSMMDMVCKRQEWREQNPSSIGGAAALKKQYALEAFADTIFGLAERAPQMELHKLIEEIVEQSGLRAHYAAEAAESGSAGGDEGNERLANIAELVSAARQFVMDNPQHESLDTLGKLSEYLAHVTLMTSTSESDMSAKNTISLMTVHSSKGLEFDHVFITGLEEKVFPHSRALDEDAVHVDEPNAQDSPGLASRLASLRETQPSAADAIERAAARGHFSGPADGPGVQEERRLMYVALTRARKTLQLSHCRERLINGEVRIFEGSRFLGELPADRLRLIDDMERNRAEQPQGRQPRRGDGYGRAWQGNGQQARSGGSAPPSVSRSASPLMAMAMAAAQGARPAAGGAPYRMSAPAAASAPSPLPRTPFSDRPACVAIIGTAGRDKARSADMSRAMWDSMLLDARQRIPKGSALVSGGAAWADHLAVALFLSGHAGSLTLHLPAPLGRQGGFEGPGVDKGGSAGSAATYYHALFHKATAVDGLAQIRRAIEMGASVTTEPAAPGYGAMTARNQKVADGCTRLIAYTWGDGDVPADGGTLVTWEMAGHAEREHAALSAVAAKWAPVLERANRSEKNTEAAEDQVSDNSYLGDERPRMKA